MNRMELVKKLRQLKKQEIAIRFSYRPRPEGVALIWNQFFSSDLKSNQVTYPVTVLLDMSHEDRKEVFTCFFFAVYHQYYKENGLPLTQLFDPIHLEALGLNVHATEEEIKKRFKELAKLHHPDKGGDSSIFIEILDAYEKLKEKF
ncbi:J domain-containing protein [Fusibacter ferrireducens]|uniref:J domain-containing protein n=1 Tax=Fusibacter ferrireducens TaxID=2785058 RepID=A0ABR9ZW15_9FIRM|nr:J domain-containing protein [Fusibacter ferrireducens]MBF4693814.1 J domain-containing protein [Fusibacter ferrireducens]